MSETPKTKTPLELQDEIMWAQQGFVDAQNAHGMGILSDQELDDAEQATALLTARATRERQEAIERRTGVKPGLSTRAKRMANKILFG